MTKSSNRKGRPSLSPIEKATHLAKTAVKACFEAENEFRAMLCLFDGEEATARGKEVMVVAESRIDVASKLNIILDKISSASSSGLDNNEVLMLKNDRSVLYEQFNSLPEMGYTFGEWDELTSEEKKKSLGRPKLPIELKLVRARLGEVEAMHKLNSLEREKGLPRTFTQHLLEQVDSEENDNSEIGRPRLDALGVLDRDIKAVREKILHITSGKAKAEQDARLEKAMQSVKGKTLGRPPVDLDERLKMLRGEEIIMAAKIDRLESNLSGVGKIDRQIKLARDELRSLKTQLSQCDEHENSVLLADIDKIQHNIDLLLDIKSGIKNEQILITSPIHSAEKSHVSTVRNAVPIQHPTVVAQDIPVENKSLSDDQFQKIREESRIQEENALKAQEAQKKIASDALAQSIQKQKDEEQELQRLISDIGYDLGDIEQRKVS